MMLLPFVLIGYLVYVGINRKHSVEHSKPLEIAKVRLAKGELSFEEFEQIKKNILEE
ncbi:putative membrane protein [Carnobacterium iners]|uniref:Putative membrane protein n=1 Tax=Carnobacterium iners TaxID=1073423 RepID=A0A1X7MU88_9LACT|nr:SHOCT domain-containing protein [Carnobacterium iners]SEK55268.1 putative membrane protein [Carnobacterium iners]SMH28402.1 putative membrane protein [Carnobacterium iners]